jgi:hypothetical protein
MPDARLPLVLLGLACLAGATPSPAQSATAELRPYTVRYEVSYLNVSGGILQGSLHREGSGPRWVYETTVEPSLLGRMLVAEDAVGRATMSIGPDGVRPLSFRLEDGKSSTKNDVRYDYDWTAMRVTGKAKSKPIDIALVPGAQDAGSIQPAILLALMAGRAPAEVPVMSGTRLKTYRYVDEGKATLDTALGRVETVIRSSAREGSDRMTRSWHAPALGFVPVQVINYRDGKPQSVLRVVELKR